MAYFRAPSSFHVDFMVACMQFINIIVHSVDDLNYRVFLQHEFQSLGLAGLLKVQALLPIQYIEDCFSGVREHIVGESPTASVRIYGQHI